ncbi:MAG TPA: protein kinase [Pyrinomonadaceae bacterium]|nr:protein kinase [Pyrinomonadaceae bacterium]
MNPERWQQISRIFKSAISLDGEARAAYVAGQCGNDESLRGEVEKLIASHQLASQENFIGGQAAEDAAELLLGDDVHVHATALSNGQQLGSYLILKKLGAGGMGEVYLARDSRLDRTVALKVLSPDVSADKRRMQRFSQEAKVASSLNQPNILTIYEFGEVKELTFLATEFIDGQTLRAYLHDKRPKLPEILDIAIQVLAALDAAHEASIVHRDIKPENVMIRRRDHVVKVLDFGLAKVTEKRPSVLVEHDSELEAATAFKTAPGIIMGTINYMSPEQAQAHAVDVRTDIWSTGVMIYEMVAGSMPFSGATSSHTIVQILEKDPVPLSQVTKEPVPAELERIVSKAMTKEPDERYQTAKDMLIDLRHLKKQLDLKAEIDRTSSPDVQRVVVSVGGEPSKKRVLLIALVAMVLATVAIFAISIWRSRRERTAPSVVTPAATPAVTEERTLTYWITVQKFRGGRAYGNPFPVAGEINFEADYRIRVHIRSPQPGYLYIFNEGPTSTSMPPEYVVVFPSPTANKNSSYLNAGQVVQIPEKTWLQFDKQQGVEKLWLVFAEEAVPDLEAVKQFASPETRGLITDVTQNKAVQNFLNNSSLPKSGAEKGETLTTVKAAGKLLVYAVKLEHH